MTDPARFVQGPCLDNQAPAGDDCRMLNQLTNELFAEIKADDRRQNIRCESILSATVVDAGINTQGSIAAGISLARICMADQADVSIVPCSVESPVDNAVFVRTDQPVQACLGSQYAGWPVQTDDFFAMGSGPMRMLRGRESMLETLSLKEKSDVAVGVLESDKLPTELAIRSVASDSGVSPSNLRLAIAPSTSIAGSIQVVARSIETSLHKLHELKFDVRNVVSGTGFAPLPPPTKPGDTVGGIGRTNDAILYGGRVTLWVNCDDDSISEIIGQVPSGASSDHGQPFAKTFKEYGYDFYKVDPMLFSPAVITIHNLRSGRTHRSGAVDQEILRQSFIS